MNRGIRHIFILFCTAVFCVLFVSNNAEYFKGSSNELTVARQISQGHVPFSAGMNRDNNHHLKNKIRVKAWDDTMHICFASIPEVTLAAHYFPHVIYGGYLDQVYSIRSFSYGLRGPPVA